MAFPKNYYKQDELIKELSGNWIGKIQNIKRVETLHTNTLVKSRHLALPIQEYFKIEKFDEKNDAYIKHAVDLATEAVTNLLEQYDLQPEDISSLWSNTVTGFCIPSLEARVMNKIKFSPNTKRVPILGLGCMAGIAGINRVAEYLIGHPTEAVIFFSVELCSLTLQTEDISAANIISTGLFGDGAAAVLMVGDEHKLKDKAPLEWLSCESVFFPDTEEVMGWDVGEKGLKIILNKGVPEVTENNLPEPLHNFLKNNNKSLKDIRSFFAHPGGPKVLNAMEKVLSLPDKGLYHSWNSLAENGNMSSVSVLDITKKHIEERKESDKPARGYGLGLAMGPAFSAEMSLLQWK
jgi:alkylresorcinol/alkylpyrone synthase